MKKTVESKELNLQVMKEFLKTDMRIRELNQDLDGLFSAFTEAVMHASYYMNREITDEQLNARFTIEQLREIFRKIQIDNEL